MKGEDDSEGSEGKVLKDGERKGNQKEILAKKNEGFCKNGTLGWDLVKVIVHFYHGKSPLNHDFGEYVLLFPSILCK